MFKIEMENEQSGNEFDFCSYKKCKLDINARWKLRQASKSEKYFKNID